MWGSQLRCALSGNLYIDPVVLDEGGNCGLFLPYCRAERGTAHLAEPRRDPSLPAYPKITDITRSASDLPFAATVRTAEYALPGAIFAAPSSKPVDQKPVVLDSTTLVEAAMGIETSAGTRETVLLLPALALDARTLEISEPASKPTLAKYAINRPGTVAGNSAESPDEKHGAAKTDPSACVACRPLPTDFDMFYLARASRGEHREPVAMSVAEVPDESESAKAVSDAQRRIDTAVPDSETRPMGEPELPLFDNGRASAVTAAGPVQKPIKPTPL